jgi:hypothetical protein
MSNCYPFNFVKLTVLSFVLFFYFLAVFFLILFIALAFTPLALFYIKVIVVTVIVTKQSYFVTKNKYLFKVNRLFEDPNPLCYPW